MSRNPLVVAIVTLVIGTTVGYVASGQPDQPARPKPPLTDITRGPKPAKKWSYLTLTEVRKNNKDDSCYVFYDLGGASGICIGGWIQVAESLGMKLAAEHTRKNTATDRGSVLNFLGDNGWELVGVHKTELDRLAWVFKLER